MNVTANTHMQPKVVINEILLPANPAPANRVPMPGTLAICFQGAGTDCPESLGHRLQVPALPVPGEGRPPHPEHVSIFASLQRAQTSAPAEHLPGRQLFRPAEYYVPGPAVLLLARHDPRATPESRPAFRRSGEMRERLLAPESSRPPAGNQADFHKGV